jgi:hypothetical protein
MSTYDCRNVQCLYPYLYVDRPRNLILFYESIIAKQSNFLFVCVDECKHDRLPSIMQPLR